MINVDISSLLTEFGNANAGKVVPPPTRITPLIPDGAGDSDGWINLILFALVVAAIGFGVYAITCDDGTQAQLRVNSRGAKLTKKEPMGPKVNDVTSDGDATH